ncbi:MAG: ABC transporter permease [Candidatus Berkiella sp.]
MIRIYCRDVVYLFNYYRMRCVFGLIGIVVGMGAICSLIALNGIVHKNSDEFMKKFGASRFVLNIMSSTTQDQKIVNRYLRSDEVTKFSDRFKDHYQLIPYKIISTKPWFEHKSLDAISIAVADKIFLMMQWEIKEGRVLHPLDEKDKVIVIGAHVAQKLKDLGINNLLGLTVNLGEHFFSIVGILEEKEFNPILDFDVNDAILFDLHLLNRFENIPTIDSFIVQGNFDSLVDSKNFLNQQLKKILGTVRFFFKDALLFEQALFKQVKLTMNILAIVAGITLLLGIVSILNLLFILIEERKKEIGLRMSFGATADEIGKQFLVESLSLSLLGGSIGLVLGQIGAYCIVKSLNIEFYWQFSSVALGALITLAIGLGVGFIPAKMAARFDPIKLINA